VLKIGADGNMSEANERAGSGVLIVTGGSRGIGAAIARLAAARGYAVAVNFAKDAAGAAAVVAAIEGQGGAARAVQADVTIEADVVRLFDQAQRLGPLAALVNNAGIAGRLERLDDTSAESVRAMFEVNALGAFLCAREAVRRMSTRRGGAGEWIHYAASKGAVDTLTVGLAREVAREGIRVNAVSPGITATGMHAAAGAHDRLERMAPAIPMGRVGKPEEVAEAVLWLLSPAAAYITGAILPVSGGR
jgi:NAD(P)-dependent dehydrogenase (short-subunit alcohol dehydrogenase family)